MATAYALVPADWPKIDLPKQHLKAFTIRWSSKDKREFEAAFAGKFDEDGDFIAVTPYRRMKVDHRRIFIASRESVYGANQIALEYRAGGELVSEPVPKDFQRTPEFMACLQGLSLIGPSRCRAEFEFSDGLNYETVFPLPFDLATTDDTAWPIDEITGVRGHRRDYQPNGIPPYRFTLDRISDETLWFLLNFEMDSGITADATEQMLQIATGIRDQFIFNRRSRK